MVYRKIKLSLIGMVLIVNVSFADNVTLGTNASAGTNSTAIGIDTNASGTGSVVDGYSSTATGAYGVTLGYDATNSAQDSIAIGRTVSITSTASDAVAIGRSVSISSSYGVGIGYNTTVSGQYGLAAAYSASVLASAGVAIGYSSQVTASASSSLAIGALSYVSADHAVAIGYAVQAKGVRSIAIGSYNGTFGLNTSISGTDSIGIGQKVQDSGIARNILIGTNLSTSSAVFDSVVFGNGIAETESNVFNVGAKRIKNLLEPVASTDATTKNYVDTTVGSAVTTANANTTTALGNYYTKSQTYSKTEVDAAITASSDLTPYATITSVDTKDATVLSNAKAYTDSSLTTFSSSYYSKAASDALYSTKTTTYTKSEVDSAITASAVDTSNFYTKATVDSNIASAFSTTLSNAKSYTDSSLGSFYDKTTSDARFAAKADTYSKSQVDSAIASGVTGLDLSVYETVANVDTKVATAQTNAVNSSKTYTDSTAATTLNSAKSYADSNFYNKSYVDTNIYTKAQTYSKTEVDAIVSGVSTTDVSGFYTKSDVNSMFANYYDKPTIDARFSNYLSSVATQSLIATAKAEAVSAAQTASGLAQANAVALSKQYTDDKVANLAPAGTTTGADKTYVDVSSATAKTTAIADAKTYTDTKTASTLSDAKAYTDTQVTAMGAKITQEQADALSASTTSVSLTKTSSITGNVHGITVYDDKTTISGGTTSTQMTLNDDTVDFKHIQTGDAVRLTGVADGVNDTDAANVRQVNVARDEAIASSNAYTDQAVSVAKKEAAQGTALAIALSTPISFQNGSNAMNIGTGFYKGEKAVALTFGKKVSDYTSYTVGVASAGTGATAVKAGIGFNW